MISAPKRTAYRAPTATPAQFTAAAALLQPSSYSTASRDGARLVLVDGLSINAAARQCGVGAPSVLRAVRRLADIVVGGCPTCGHAIGAPSGGRRDPAPSKGRRDPRAQAAQSPKKRAPDARPCIDDIRITKGVARYTAPFTPPAADVLTTGGTGLNDQVLIEIESVWSADHADWWDMGGSDWTIECLARPWVLGASQILIGKRADDTDYAPFVLYCDAAGEAGFLISTSGSAWDVNILSDSALFAAGTWAHVAMCRQGGTIYCWVNGVSAGSASISGPLMVPATGGAPLQHPSETPPDADFSTGEPWLLAKPRQTRKPGPAAEAEDNP